MHTKHITIGRNPELTIAILRLAAIRQQRKVDRAERRSKWLRLLGFRRSEKRIDADPSA
jgi:hypothetical protein